MISLARPATLIRVVLLFACAASAARAQRPTLSSLQPGDTIKVWAVSPILNGVRGTLTSLHADTLTLGEWPPNPAAAARAEVSYAALRRVDVRHGKHRSAIRIAAGIILGGAGGLVLGAYAGDAFDCRNGCTRDLSGVPGGAVGGTLGLIGGAIAGGMIGGQRTERWEEVLLRR